MVYVFQCGIRLGALRADRIEAAATGAAFAFGAFCTEGVSEMGLVGLDCAVVGELIDTSRSAVIAAHTAPVIPAGLIVILIIPFDACGAISQSGCGHSMA
jgi:hypothetical protein